MCEPNANAERRQPFEAGEVVGSTPTWGTNFMKEEMMTVTCDCTKRSGFHKNWLEELASGVWGTVRCPYCGTSLIPKFKQLYNESERLPS